MIENSNEYFELLNDIKNTVIKTRRKIVINANNELILMYYNIGKKLIEHNKWGTSYIDTLAKDIKRDFPDLKGMSSRNLRYMKKFATDFKDDEFLQHHVAKLPWSSITTIMDKVKIEKQRVWYIKKAIENDWTRKVIIHQIESRLYERQNILKNKTTNYNETINNEQLKELLKDSYIFDFLTF